MRTRKVDENSRADVVLEVDWTCILSIKYHDCSLCI